MTVVNKSSEEQTPVVYTGLSGDSKPTPAYPGGGARVQCVFHETDTENKYEYNGSTWVLTHIGGRQLTTEFLLEVQAGNVPGFSMVHKFGKNEAVGTTWEHVSQVPFSIANFRQSAVAMRIKAGGNAADDAAGAGARGVAIQGIDSNFDETTEIEATAGASASSATTSTFWRVHRTWVDGVGTYTGANTGDIVIEDSVSGADFIQITADEGQSQYAGWTVPRNKTAYLLGTDVTVDASTTRTVDIRCFTRNDIDIVSAPMKPKRLKLVE